jgi:hypothetical protein
MQYRHSGSAASLVYHSKIVNLALNTYSSACIALKPVLAAAFCWQVGLSSQNQYIVSTFTAIAMALLSIINDVQSAFR